MSDENALIKKLEAQQAQLKARIKQAKAQAAKKAAALHEERCRIIGAAIIQEMEQNPAFADQVQPIINARTTAPSARKMLGLEPLPKEPQATQTSEEEPNTVSSGFTTPSG